MKRSEINKIMRDAIEFIDEMKFKLPPFAYWSVEDWATKGKEYDEIRDNMLGWDITDFGSGDFLKIDLHISFENNTSYEEIMSLQKQMQEEFGKEFGNCVVNIIVEDD